MGINVDEASCFVKALPAVDGSSVSNTQPLLKLRPEARARICHLPTVFGTESPLCNLPRQTNPNQNEKKTTQKIHIFQNPESNSFIVRPQKNVAQTFAPKNHYTNWKNLPKTSPPAASQLCRLPNRAPQQACHPRQPGEAQETHQAKASEDFFGATNLVIRRSPSKLHWWCCALACLAILKYHDSKD